MTNITSEWELSSSGCSIRNKDTGHIVSEFRGTGNVPLDEDRFVEWLEIAYHIVYLHNSKIKCE